MALTLIAAGLIEIKVVYKESENENEKAKPILLASLATLPDGSPKLMHDEYWLGIPLQNPGDANESIMDDDIETIVGD